MQSLSQVFLCPVPVFVDCKILIYCCHNSCAEKAIIATYLSGSPVVTEAGSAPENVSAFNGHFSNSDAVELSASKLPLAKPSDYI